MNFFQVKSTVAMMVAVFLTVSSLISCGDKKNLEEHEHHQHDHEHEGHIELSQKAIHASGIRTEKVGPQKIQTLLEVNGKLALDEDRVVHIMPRFPGVAKEIRKKLGDHVEIGEVLAVIESNQSLKPYEIRSQVSGTIVKRHLTAGEFAESGKDIFVIANLSDLWVDFRIYRNDFDRIHKGQLISVIIDAEHPPIPAQISYVSPFGEEATQSKIARAIIPNEGGVLYPGLYVRGHIVVSETDVPLAVRDAALQLSKGKTIVFVKEETHFIPQEVTIGKSDGQFHEVLEGVEIGDEYVTENSFVMKSELEKGEAEHEH